MHLKKCSVLFIVLLLTLTANSQDNVNIVQVWTLKSSIEQSAKFSPIVGAAEAEVRGAEASVMQAGSWPNPTIEVTGNNKLGLGDGTGGNEITAMSFSQTIPLGRLSYERTEANAQLKATRYDRDYRKLVLENNTAKAFHKLQLTEAKLELAKEQLKFADDYQQGKGKTSSPLVRYLSSLEKKRLLILRELANQEVSSAEDEYNAALLSFKTLMQLSKEKQVKADLLKPYSIPNDFKNLQENQVNHTGMKALKFKLEAAEAAIDLAKGKRIPDLTFTLFRELDNLDNRRQRFNGLSLGITIPLWDFNTGNIAKTQAESQKIRYDAQSFEIELKVKLQKSFNHLERLVTQSENYRTKILAPAEEVLKLTNKSFNTGGVNVLSLIDANNTYFDARKRYLDFLFESWVEAAEVREAAGISLVNNSKNEGAL